LTDGSQGAVAFEALRKILQARETEGSKAAGFADKLTRKHRFATLRDTEQVLFYKDGAYRSGGEAIIKAEVEKLDPKHCTTQTCREVIGHIQRRTYHDREEFDADPYILNLSNGLLDTRKLELKSHTPDHLSRIQLPVCYTPTAKCPQVLRFVQDVMPDQECRRALLEHAAYTLLPTCFLQKAFMYVGEGRNGKSTWCETLSALLGRENVANESIHNLENNRFSAANLDGKLSNFYADISSSEISHTGKLKNIIAGDTIQVEKKHLNAFQLRPRTKLFFLANRIPEVHDDSDAWFRRWIILEWREKFGDGGRTIDRELLEKLTTPEELSGLLAILAPLASKLLQRRKLSYETTINQLRSEWLEKADLIHAFLNSTVETQPEAYVPRSELYAKYVEWSHQHNYAPKGTRTFNEELQRKFPVTAATPKPGGRTGKSVRVWKGIRWRNPTGSPVGSTGSTDSPRLFSFTNLQDAESGRELQTTSRTPIESLLKGR
jgi:putative DNA primase/helicase